MSNYDQATKAAMVKSAVRAIESDLMDVKESLARVINTLQRTPPEFNNSVCLHCDKDANLKELFSTVIGLAKQLENKLDKDCVQHCKLGHHLSKS